VAPHAHLDERPPDDDRRGTRGPGATRGSRRPDARTLGLLLAGWGLFNLVEGLIDHQLLGVHHVRDDLGGPLGWDLAFLTLGAGLLLTCWALVSSTDESPERLR
jgi:uncharacterized membrane protein